MLGEFVVVGGCAQQARRGLPARKWAKKEVIAGQRGRTGAKRSAAECSGWAQGGIAAGRVDAGRRWDGAGVEDGAADAEGPGLRRGILVRNLGLLEGRERRK